MFIIGDEMPYPQVKPREVSAWIGDEIPQPVALRNLIAQLTRRWDTCYILPAGASYAGDGQVLGAWRALLVWARSPDKSRRLPPLLRVHGKHDDATL